MIWSAVPGHKSGKTTQMGKPRRNKSKKKPRNLHSFTFLIFSNLQRYSWRGRNWNWPQLLITGWCDYDPNLGLNPGEF